MRDKFLSWGIVLVVATWIVAILIRAHYWIPTLLSAIYALGVYNAYQSKHAILRNFPVLGYFRYFFESISPEMQQYFIERETDGKPFPRNQRSAVYRRAKNLSDTVAFGTQLEVNHRKYEGIKHSIYAKSPSEELPRVWVGGEQCTQPYHASLFNISAMSFGALSDRAQISLNRGAKKEISIIIQVKEEFLHIIWRRRSYAGRSEQGILDVVMMKENLILNYLKIFNYS
jgi:glutamate synthase domain-containing protein 2